MAIGRRNGISNNAANLPSGGLSNVGTWDNIVIEDNTAITDNVGSTVVNLPTSDFIANLDINIFGTGGSGTVDLEGGAVITLVELIANGSNTIHYANDEETRDIYTFATGIIPPLVETTSGASDVIGLPITFQRHPEDTEYLLPAGLLDTLQLRLTWNADFIDSTEFATNTVKLGVSAKIYRSKMPLTSVKVLARRNIDSHATATNSAKYVDVPRGNPIRRFYVGGTAVAQSNLSKMEVLLNNGSSIPFSNRFDYQSNDNKARFRMPTAITDRVAIPFDNPLMSAQYSKVQLRYNETVDAAATAVRTTVEEVLRASQIIGR